MNVLLNGSLATSPFFPLTPKNENCLAKQREIVAFKIFTVSFSGVDPPSSLSDLI